LEVSQKTGERKQMKITCLTKKFQQSIAASDHREKFNDWLGKRNCDNMPIISVDLFESKTRSQLNCIWRDFGEIAKLLFTDSLTVYAICMRSEQLKYHFIKESSWGVKKENKITRLHSLSEFSKKDCMEFISEMRDFLQGLVNKEYGEYTVINWSKIENIGKPFVEKLNKNV